MMYVKWIGLFILIGMVSCNNSKNLSNTKDMDLEYLKEKEGELIYFVGTFNHKKENVAFSTNRLVLSDGTEIILSQGSFEDKEQLLTKKMDKKCLQILGRVYVGMIPEKYKIISRTSSPYLVDMEKVESCD